jgi:hypothetical protein
MFFRRRQTKTSNFEELLQAVRASGFETGKQEDGRVRVARDGCAALIENGPDSLPRLDRAGWVECGGIAQLIDGGYQKFWQAGNRRFPALAQQLKALHNFEEDLREALGLESLYNTSLGTTNDLHVYDRVAGRGAAAH